MLFSITFEPLAKLLIMFALIVRVEGSDDGVNNGNEWIEEENGEVQRLQT